MGFRRGQVPQVIAGKKPGPGKQPRKPTHFTKRYPRRRKAPFGLRQVPPTAIYHPYPQSAGTRMRVQKSQALLKAVFRQDGIGVQEKDVLSLTCCEGLVIGAAKARIFRIGDKSYKWKTGLQVSGTAIRGVIVHHQHLCQVIKTLASQPGRLLQGPFHGTKALFQEIPDIVVDNYNRQQHGTKIRSLPASGSAICDLPV